MTFKLSRLLAAGAMATGALASASALRRRVAREQAGGHVALAVDYDDVVAVAVRAGLSLAELLARLRAAGATHLSLPEDTFARLMAQGRVAPVVPGVPIAEPAP